MTINYRFEVTVLPVSDVDRAKQFYETLGWRLDADFPINDSLRIVQLTPPGSKASIQFGVGLTAAPAGSSQDLMLIVDDLEEAREDLLSRGIKVSEAWHGLRGLDTSTRRPGPDPDGRSYGSYASFTDPDGNGWLLQQVTERLPNRD
ncbi:VOC family protein [Paractinoplanes hotanensis]|uniref:VOC family protein n=1 Tax=Paractinoplanes hotanensis TaxID=2906497 RepID=A0ABT0YHB5_9ACTN|nr:VOC family protein [Actinoplanes hotanensis]MCM4084887.1 VOC family protein [Actinoplanes hotanensis]